MEIWTACSHVCITWVNWEINSASFFIFVWTNSFEIFLLGFVWSSGVSRLPRPPLAFCRGSDRFARWPARSAKEAKSKERLRDIRLRSVGWYLASSSSNKIFFVRNSVLVRDVRLCSLGCPCRYTTSRLNSFISLLFENIACVWSLNLSVSV